MSLPSLQIARLLLRPFAPADARVVQQLAGVREVALNTINIPHPYPDGVAEEWIATHGSNWNDRKSLTLAVVAESEGLIGGVSLQLTMRHHRGELGYWVGVPFWNRGFATEAITAVIGYGFEELALHRIQGRHITRNPASGRVMVKVGMRFEGIFRDQMLVKGEFEDTAMYGILRTDKRGLANR